MLTSFLIPSTNGGSSHHAPDANASPGGNTPPPGEDPMLIDAETRPHTQVVKICMPMNITGMLNPFPYVQAFVKHLIAPDPSAMLLSEDPAITSVNSPDKVPKNDKINHFAVAPQTIGNCCQQSAFFLMYCSTKSLSQIKFETIPMIRLEKSCIWDILRSHCQPRPCTRRTSVLFMECIQHSPTVTCLKANSPPTWRL
jgi:hypothetical protein